MDLSSALYSNFVSVRLPFTYFVIAGVSLPLFGVILSLIVSTYTSFDEVTESVCGVSNFVPSISAVTGITPQLYFWRYAVGLHSAPRLLLAFTYYRFHTYYHDFLSLSNVFKILAQSALLLNLIDVASFVGVAYVSNRENFPIHERLFIVFLFASTIYMIIILIMHNMLKARISSTPRFLHSYNIKAIFFVLNLTFIILLLQYFYAHRFLCQPNAFSWFSASEYGIAIANMGFHLTAAYDFQDLQIITTPIYDKISKD